MKRRTFLSVVGGASAAVMVGRMRRSRADTFGAFPATDTSLQLPDGVRAKKVLEIFLYGGLSAWETLYFVRNYGKPTDPQFPNQQYYAFTSDNASAFGACGGADIPRVVGTDDLGASVELGPFAYRLWNRQDLVSRMRIVVQKHNLEPHEAAVPQALTGRPVGQPNAAGLGAHVQRARIDGGLTPDRASPYSYVFATGGITSDNIAAAASSGSHPGSARPLLIKTDNASGFTTLLQRNTVGTGRATNDALVAAYVDQYNARLTWPGQGRVRSPRTDDLDVAFTTTTKVDAIQGVLTPTLFTQRSGTSCGQSKPFDIPLVGLGAAAHLLTHPTEPASYVCVSDVGLYEASGGGGYDTHTDNARDTATNFDNMLQSLLGIINAPGETDPAKLSLDDTLIILNTEFGRTPIAQDGGNGRNHHPYGYATAFIGGPITAAQKGVSGAIGPDGQAIDGAGTPSENRIAALLALGIWPFSQDAFAVSDVPNAVGENDAASAAMMKYLGRTA
jgi:Protein of unknown function (DUF1501)